MGWRWPVLHRGCSGRGRMPVRAFKARAIDINGSTRVETGVFRGDPHKYIVRSRGLGGLWPPSFSGSKRGGFVPLNNFGGARVFDQPFECHFALVKPVLQAILAPTMLAQLVSSSIVLNGAGKKCSTFLFSAGRRAALPDARNTLVSG
jgi:hypothetical protein